MKHRDITRGALAGVLLFTAIASIACGAAKPSAAKSEAGSLPATTTVTIQTRDGASFVLADARGITLYYFSGDDAGASVKCEGACASNWTPLTSTSANVEKPVALPSTLDTVKRSDGTLQVRYSGRPLYRFTADKAPGDRNGQDQQSLTVAFVELACDCGNH